MPRPHVPCSTRHLGRAEAKLIKCSIGAANGGRFISLMNHYLDHKGLEWTSERVKTLWNVALLLRAGKMEDIPSVLSSGRINRLSEDGLPKGIEGVVVRTWSRIKSAQTLRRWSVTLRVYTSIRLPVLSEKQLRKSRHSINDPGFQPKVKPIGRLRRVALFDRKGAPEGKSLETLLPYFGRLSESSLRRPMLEELSGVSNYPFLYFKLNAEVKSRTPYISCLASLLTKGRVPACLTRLLGDVPMRQAAEEIQYMAGDETFGNISIIQEGGAKGRVVCSPNAWVQLYMKPLHEALMSYLIRLETDFSNDQGYCTYVAGSSCVTDQLRGVYLAQRALETNTFCECVDLSSATDRFPLSIQLATLEELGLPTYAEALKELTGPYKGLDNSEWYYNQGQPMGLFGSFPLFHLSHFAMLNALSFTLGLPGNRRNFAVIGDDVILFNRELRDAYLLKLREWGVPVSTHKCYSDNLVEFAGFIISRNRDGDVSAFRPYKYGLNGKFSSVLNVLHAIGQPCNSWSAWWKRALDLYRRTVGGRFLDLSPITSNADEPVGLSARLDQDYCTSVIEMLAHVPTKGTLPWTVDDSLSWEWLSLESKNSLSSLLGLPEASSVSERARQTGFDPKIYTQLERQRKNLQKGFLIDPLVQLELQKTGLFSER